MACVANLQYGWTLFVNPIDAKYHWGRAAIQVAFTTFVLIETWLVPVEGYLVDKFGPRWVVIGGGILVAIAWVINSVADSLPVLYFAAAIGGIGTGCVYGTCVGNALKWFPGRRGIAAGFTAAGFGAGAALTVIPISHMIATDGYQHAFFVFGLLQGGIVFVMGWLLLVPPPSILNAAVKRNTTAHGYKPSEVLRSPVFYVLYLMFVLIAAGGLSMTASVKPLAADLKIDKIPVDLFGVVLTAGIFAVSLSRIFDGVGRPFFGWLSDRIGRETHHGHRVSHRRRRSVHAEPDRRQQSGGIRARDRAVFRRVRRNLQFVSCDPGRHFRRPIRGGECGHAVHRQGHGSAARSNRRGHRQGATATARCSPSS